MMIDALRISIILIVMRQTESALITHHSFSIRMNGLSFINIGYFMQDERYNVWLLLQYEMDAVHWYCLITVYFQLVYIVDNKSLNMIIGIEVKNNNKRKSIDIQFLDNVIILKKWLWSDIDFHIHWVWTWNMNIRTMKFFQ